MTDAEVCRVVLVDDEEDVRMSTAQTLDLEGMRVTACDSGEAALEVLDAYWPGIVVTDLKMPRMDGLALLARVSELDRDLPVVIVSGHGDIPMAVQAMRDGAYDFVEKTANPTELVGTVRRALEKRRLVVENRALRRKLESAGKLERRIIGDAPAMQALRETLIQLAVTDVEVLIFGETGTGKELVARCLHDFGRRAGRPFVALNCGALPASTIESELFGHEAGAFTGASRQRIGKVQYAEGGTLFLDEIESMPLELQVKLLRVLQERVIERLGRNEPIPVDIRVVAATKENLLEASESDRFRADLFYRLSVANVEIPPLRERPDDVPLLFHEFIAGAARRYGKAAPAADASTLAALQAQGWPGNVRELRNAADRFVLGMPLGGSGSSARASSGPESLVERMARFERETIADELRRNGGRVGQTADALGLPRKTLYLRMRKYGLSREDYR